MSVFTTVTPEQLSVWLKDYSIGVLTDLRGILAGIENTNYFVTTSHGRYVLTLFEKLQPAELPFYLDLMAHLSAHGLPCPQPIANLRNRYLGELNGKPATIVTFLEGKPEMAPSAEHCARVARCWPRCTRPGRPSGAIWTTCVAPGGGVRARRNCIDSSATRTPNCCTARSASRRDIGTTICRAG